MNEGRGTLGKALAALEEALGRDPLNGPFLYAMAALLALSGRPEQARNYLDQAERAGVNGKVLRNWLSKAAQEGISK